MKNVTFVIHELGIGGAERAAAIICSNLAELSDQYTVNIIRYSDKHNDYLLSDKCNIYTLPYSSNRIIRVLKKFVAFIAICKKTRTDTLVILAIGDHMTYATKKILGLKLILSQRNDPVAEYENNLHKKSKAIKYFRNADTVVFQTDEERDYFEDEIKNKGIIIPNPIKSDLPMPYKGIRRKEVVNFCRLEPQKNLPLLINAFWEFHKIHPEYVLKIYGRGGEKENLLRLIDSLSAGEYVYIYDFVSNIHEVINGAAMFVSTSDFEGISNSMIEAMGLGLPVVCTDCPAGGSRMMIKDHYNGLLIPVNDKYAAVEAMCEIAENSALADELSKNAISIRKTLSMHHIGSMWRKIIND